MSIAFEQLQREQRQPSQQPLSLVDPLLSAIWVNEFQPSKMKHKISLEKLTGNLLASAANSLSCHLDIPFVDSGPLENAGESTEMLLNLVPDFDVSFVSSLSSSPLSEVNNDVSSPSSPIMHMGGGERWNLGYEGVTIDPALIDPTGITMGDVLEGDQLKEDTGQPMPCEDDSKLKTQSQKKRQQSAEAFKFVFYHPSSPHSEQEEDVEIQRSRRESICSEPAFTLTSPSIDSSSPTVESPEDKCSRTGGARRRSAPSSCGRMSDEPMPCPHEGCGKSFTRYNSLKAHLRLHASSRPFECPMCKRSFARKHDLHRHIRVHTGAKPYECLACKKGFARSDALRRHWRVDSSCGNHPAVASIKGRRRHSVLSNKTASSSA
ncbi:uncharacterized protein VTP21DRAFT_2328 [Calcarisporiella thermophila]|uniref:uncharacterized protein n=1 Tax=Calcarisporiella thermophila TaxID=911321 RepID=UPI0037423057